jgi:large subunit ribosomal protein L5
MADKIDKAEKGGKKEPKGKVKGKGGGGAAIATATAAELATVPPSRLHQKYKDSIVPALKEQFGYKSLLAVPRLDKIVVNMGIGRAEDDAKQLENSVRDLTLIAGQRPVVTKAKKAISNFKIREGNKVGCRVTLRGERMYHFFDKLVSIVLPRLRDFRGLSPKADYFSGDFLRYLRQAAWHGCGDLHHCQNG